MWLCFGEAIFGEFDKSLKIHPSKRPESHNPPEAFSRKIEVNTPFKIIGSKSLL